MRCVPAQQSPTWEPKNGQCSAWALAHRRVRQPQPKLPLPCQTVTSSSPGSRCFSRFYRFGHFRRFILTCKQKLYTKFPVKRRQLLRKSGVTLTAVATWESQKSKLSKGQNRWSLRWTWAWRPTRQFRASWKRRIPPSFGCIFHRFLQEDLSSIAFGNFILFEYLRPNQAISGLFLHRLEPLVDDDLSFAATLSATWGTQIRSTVI